MTEDRINRIQHVLNHRQENITVILENVFDPHNIAAVLRTVDAIGVSEIYSIKTYMPVRKFFGMKSSSSAIKWVKIHEFETVDDCIAAVRKKYDVIFTTHLSSNSKTLYEIDLTTKVALAFGNEKEGLSDEFLKHSDGNFIIPQVGMIQSLNISVACAITMYEAMRQKKNVGQYLNRTVSDAKVNELLTFWEIDEAEKIHFKSK